MTKFKSLSGLLLIITFAASTVMAGTNAKAGKVVFQNNCKICHSKGAEGGYVSPDSKTRSQWRRFFKKNQHDAKPDVIEKLNQNELKSLRMFLDSSAADADKAETCG